MKKFLDPEFELLKLTLRDVICNSLNEVDSEEGWLEESEPLPPGEDEGFGE
jgi:hypothetical protein